jgi:hypothetical protein
MALAVLFRGIDTDPVLGRRPGFYFCTLHMASVVCNVRYSFRYRHNCLIYPALASIGDLQLDF